MQSVDNDVLQGSAAAAAAARIDESAVVKNDTNPSQVFASVFREEPQQGTSHAHAHGSVELQLQLQIGQPVNESMNNVWIL